MTTTSAKSKGASGVRAATKHNAPASKAPRKTDDVLKAPPLQSAAPKKASGTLPTSRGPSAEDKTVNARYYSAKAVFGEFEDMELTISFQRKLDDAKLSLSPKEFIVRAAELTESAKARQKSEKVLLKDVPPEKRAMCARAVSSIHEWQQLKQKYPELVPLDENKDMQEDDLSLVRHIELFKSGKLTPQAFDLLVGRAICDCIFQQGRMQVKALKATLDTKSAALVELQKTPPSDPAAFPAWEKKVSAALKDVATAASILDVTATKAKESHVSAMRQHGVME